ncbi:hypothetical protein LC653_35925 [Nostoc sp. CHAB 5784]|uniref:hypothetical protein n=1 Tax=Nostoc mirabile TaxID=2907820 RepID=UPI001E5640D0|nr:hypothetical protein [Nostoc mirabile]MCC5669104.1 hypothetical protein [Nostoc mirabile CHAB5784]
MSLFPETDQILNRLEEQQARTSAAVESLADAVTRLTQNAETDRQVFQAEIRRIWEYLLGQQGGNGRGEG